MSMNSKNLSFNSRKRLNAFSSLTSTSSSGDCTEKINNEIDLNSDEKLKSKSLYDDIFDMIDIIDITDQPIDGRNRIMTI